VEEWGRPASVCAEGMPLAEDLAESVKGWRLRLRLRLRAKEQKGVSKTKLPARMTSVGRSGRHYVY